MADIDYGRIENVYKRLASKYFQGIATRIEEHLKHFVDYSRIDKVSCRPKSVDSFMKKCHNLDKLGNLKYSDPLKQVQDQIGARIVTFYKDDLQHIQQIVKRSIAESKGC